MKPDRVRRNFATLFGRGCFVFGALLVLVAGAFTLHTASFIHRSIAAPGTIVGLTQHIGSDGALNYAPIFSFSTQDGLTYTITSAVASNPPSFRVGQSVPVLYESAQPEGARIGTFWQLWLVQFVFGGLGVTALFGGYIISSLEKRRIAAITPVHASSGLAG